MRQRRRIHSFDLSANVPSIRRRISSEALHSSRCSDRYARQLDKRYLFDLSANIPSIRQRISSKALHSSRCSDRYARQLDKRYFFNLSANIPSIRLRISSKALHADRNYNCPVRGGRRKRSYLTYPRAQKGRGDKRCLPAAVAPAAVASVVDAPYDHPAHRRRPLPAAVDGGQECQRRGSLATQAATALRDTRTRCPPVAAPAVWGTTLGHNAPALVRCDPRRHAQATEIASAKGGFVTGRFQGRLARAGPGAKMGRIGCADSVLGRAARVPRVTTSDPDRP
jgi:hypothetical protein